MKKNIINILDLCKSSKNRVVKPSSNPAIEIKKQLLLIRTFLDENITYNREKYKIKISQGAGFFPRNPWVALLMKGKNVSETLSVCLCFSKNGNGCVLGVMYFTKSDNKYFKTVERKRIGDDFIDISGSNLKTAHNNHKFLNPIEFHYNRLDEKKIITHYKKSIEMLEKLDLERS